MPDPAMNSLYLSLKPKPVPAERCTDKWVKRQRWIPWAIFLLSCGGTGDASDLFGEGPEGAGDSVSRPSESQDPSPATQTDGADEPSRGSPAPAEVSDPDNAAGTAAGPATAPAALSVDEGTAAPGEQADSDPPPANADDLAEPSPVEQAAAVSFISIERARYDADDEELEIRGEVSSEEVTLEIQLGSRVEALENDEGRFRETFEDLSSPPAQIVIVASDGATASLDVEVRD